MAIPTAVRNRVLELYRHRCAICGRDKPQLHHIDADPSNNDELNLLPLCPNHHLVDAHDPTAPLDPLKLRLFREYRDPSILAPEFHPIFRRLRFVLEPDTIGTLADASDLVNDLVGFLNQFAMGRYYHARIHGLLWIPNPSVEGVSTPEGVAEAWERVRAQALEEFKSELKRHRAQILFLVVEMLRYQPWAERFTTEEQRE